MGAAKGFWLPEYPKTILTPATGLKIGFRTYLVIDPRCFGDVCACGSDVKEIKRWGEEGAAAVIFGPLSLSLSQFQR